MNISAILKKIFTNNPGIILFYVLLAFFFTFPLILNITDSMATGNNSIDNEYLIDSDPLYFAWNLWFFKNNLFDLKINPFGASDMIFYPQGFNIAATGYDNLLNSFLSLPLQLASDNLILTYNILIIFNFVFAAYASYLLIKYLTENKNISFMGGIIFAFSPYMMARSLVHFNLITSGAIPLFILFFIKMIREKKYANSILSAIGFFFVSISSWQYGLFTSLFIILSLIFFSIYQRSVILSQEFKKKFVLFVFLSVVLIAPIVFPLIETYADKEIAIQPPSQTFFYSASLLSFFTPSPLSTFMGRFIDPFFFKSFSTNIMEGTTYLGFLEILMLMFFIQNRKKIALTEKYWLFLFASFFILALGPFLKISPLFGLYFDGLSLPYNFIFKYVPFFNLAREPVRLTIFIALFSAIIFSLSLKYIFNKNDYTPHKQKMILLFVALTIIAERMILPYPIEKIGVPAFYYEISKEKENYAIIDLPVSPPIIAQFSLYNYYQSIHKKKIVSGKLVPNAFSGKTHAFINDDDLLRNGSCLAEASPREDPKDQKIEKEKEIKKLKDNNIKYVIVHKDLINYINANQNAEKGKNLFDCGLLEKNIKRLFDNTRPTYEDEMIKVYDITEIN